MRSSEYDQAPASEGSGSCNRAQEHSYSPKQTIPKVKLASAGAEETSSQEPENLESTAGPTEDYVRGRHSDGEVNVPRVRRPKSVGVLDYSRTSEWLKGILNQGTPYRSKLTERPSMGKSDFLRRPSEPILGKAHDQEVISSSSRSNCPSVGKGFERTVDDLEHLLGEALSLASKVVEQSTFRDTSEDSPLQGPAGEARTKNQLPDTRSCVTDRGKGFKDIDLESKREKAPDSTTVPKPKSHRMSAPKHAHEVYPGESEVSAAAQTKPGHLEWEIPLTVPSRQSSKRRISGVHHRHPVLLEMYRQRVTARTPKEHAEGSSGRDVDPPPRNEARDLAPGPGRDLKVADDSEEIVSARDASNRRQYVDPSINLYGRSHVSLSRNQGFSMVKTHRRQPIARDWSPSRKKFVATVACLTTAVVGIVLGIYAGIVPSVQYYILDRSHAAVHGNTGCFLALALPTFCFWPLGLLHGRKPYILAGLVAALPLLFPQALAVNSQRLEDTASWTTLLLTTRTLMGIALGFTSMNCHSILTDLFGASLMSANPHQEVVDQYDPRRHGGGMGAWLGIWTWCWIGSLALGFLIGAAIIEESPPAWGFYVSMILITAVLLLNVVSPEVRRSPYRRSITEIRNGHDVSRRIGRGEVMMHRVQTGPRWWGQEAYHSMALSLEMLRQPGFAIMAIYCGWIYAQVVLIMLLLSSIASRLYRLRSPFVGLAVAGIALGALLAIPFQKAGLFSRSRSAMFDTNRTTMEKKVTWSSHFMRRSLFTILLPLAGIGYTLVSTGPSLSIAVPVVFAILVGFLSSLAISECNGIIMETFDTSDLLSGMTGHEREAVGGNMRRTNYSAFPRITGGFAVIHTFAFIFAAIATAVGGVVSRTLGQRVASGVVAGVLLVLTSFLLLALVRFKTIQIVPRCKSEEMDRLEEARRRSSLRRASMPNNLEAMFAEEVAWQPHMLGNPTGKMRRMNLLELGALSRWNEIRIRNHIIDQGINLNRAAVDHGIEAVRSGAHDLVRMASLRTARSKRSNRSTETSEAEMDVLPRHTTNAAARQGRSTAGDQIMRQSVREETEDEMINYSGARG